MLVRGGYRPYQGWFDERHYVALAAQKFCFFSRFKPIELSPCFDDFRAWLRPLRFQFAKGFNLQSSYMADLGDHQDLGGSPDDIPSFDDETLEGRIHYASFIEQVPRLSGQLEGLIIRYDPKAIPLPTLTSAGAC
jgi:hypothetical protein